MVEPIWELSRTGEWANADGGFPGDHFHTVAELHDEVNRAGCVVEQVETLLDGSPRADAVAEYSPHIMAVARRMAG